MLAATTIAGAADAQTYYARQRLVGVTSAPSYTYTPTYGSYGSCVKGTKTAPVSGCTRSDGQSVATSFCTQPARTASCSAVCPTPVYNGQWGVDSTGFTLISGSITSASAAQAACTSYLAAKGPALCGWNSASSNVYTWGSTSTTTFNNTALYISTCQ